MKGSYILQIKLEKDKYIQIGKLGKLFFKKGTYFYVGSALNSLDKRVERHLRSDKKRHWHIDYFLDHAKIVNVFYKENESKEECNIAKTFEDNMPYIKDFGSSDCKCNSHLFYSDLTFVPDMIYKLNLKIY